MLTKTLAILIGLIALAVPIAATLGWLGLSLQYLESPMPLHRALGDIVWQTGTDFLLVAIPMFVLLGEILLRAGITERMYDGIVKWLGWLPGGLMHSNIGSSALFAATSGSSVATAATIGTVAIPQIKKRGYNEPLFLGTIAAGVAKAYADLITISGHDGGTGASPLSSIRYAGSPWELGLSEAHQALRASNLRHKVRLQADGGLKTGLDVVKAAILGAESFGFGTGPMIAMGCKYLRICHLNNCATGVATQRRDIIDHHYIGEKERVINYFSFIANEVQEILAKLGVPDLESIIGQTQYLKDITQDNPSTANINLSPILYSDKKLTSPHYCNTSSNNPWDKGNLNVKILQDIKPFIAKDQKSDFHYKISNRDRSVGAQASGFIASLYGERGLKQSQTLNFTGSAGQSFGVWNAAGLNLNLNGDANDYVGKGMNGGKIVISSSAEFASQKSPSVLVGNTALYGATGGELYVGGCVGERFAVRNSGASAVIEGAGDHCCEYMTGGHVTVLGNVGANFGAGMTGGFAYVLDTDRRFFDQCNRSLINLDRIVSEEMESHRKFLKQILTRHIKETKSERAKLILDEFDRFEPSFWLVSPAALNIQDLLKATTANAA